MIVTDAVFDPSCTLDNSAGGGITRVFCVVAGGSEQIQSYVYSGAVSGSGIKLHTHCYRTTRLTVQLAHEFICVYRNCISN